MGRLNGKRVLLTGTGTVGGQGSAIQEVFAREGARVVGCDVRPGAAEATARALADEGLDVVGHTVDLSDPDAAAEWIEAGAEHPGGTNGVLHNAARPRVIPLAGMTPGDSGPLLTTGPGNPFPTPPPAPAPPQPPRPAPA